MVRFTFQAPGEGYLTNCHRPSLESSPVKINYSTARVSSMLRGKGEHVELQF